MFRLIPAIDQTYLSFQRPRGLGLARSLILTHSGSGLVPRKTVIGINIATSASRSDQDFREKYTPGHVSPSSLKYTGDESKGPRAANASLKNNHPVFIFPHHDSDGSQDLFYVRRRTYLFTRSIGRGVRSG